MNRHVLFIQGAGEGAHDEDRLLVESLRAALGPAYAVIYPRMVNEDSPEYGEWRAQISAELDRLDGMVVLVGHSLGGSVLLRYLADERAARPIAALITLAAPFWGADSFWTWDDVRLPEDAAAWLARVPNIVLYHSRDDGIVPFEHHALLAAMLPQATVRAVDGRGHQFGNDLADVAEDICAIERTVSKEKP